jgi:hypothetical protein
MINTSEIPESLLGKEIMTNTRYSKTPAGGGIFLEEKRKSTKLFDGRKDKTITSYCVP